MDEKPKSSALSVPVAIVVAGALIAGAVFLTNKGSSIKPPSVAAVGDATSISVDKVTAADHLLGSPDAKVIVVEYSDLECPYCKVFHQTMNRIMDEYAKDGSVAWVYRQYPIEQLHPKAPKEAEASECVAELGGNSAFWSFINKVFDITPSNNGLDPAILPQLAEQVGVNRKAFEDCLSSGRHQKTIEASMESGTRAGVQGTPYSVIVTKDGKTIPLEGAQPYSSVKTLIGTILSQNN